MFDISKPEMINKTFRMPKELVDRLSDVAQEKDVSVNYLVIQCCEFALKNLSENIKKAAEDMPKESADEFYGKR